MNPPGLILRKNFPLLGLVSGLLLTSCTPVRESVDQPPRPHHAIQAPQQVRNPRPATLTSIPEPARATTCDVSDIVFEGVAFDSHRHRLVVVDQPDGPGTRFSDAADAGRAMGGQAAVNAGFFTPEGTPLGMVVSNGKSSGTWNSSSSLGSGLWLELASGQSAITRREKTGRSGAGAARELIQAGPLLVENGRTVSGLDAVKSSVRTVILWDGGSRWWIGRSSACTLSQLAAALSHGQPAGWPVHHALNLDGGRSSDLWISETITGGPISRRTPWNRPVRNFIVLVRH